VFDHFVSEAGTWEHWCVCVVRVHVLAEGVVCAWRLIFLPCSLFSPSELGCAGCGFGHYSVPAVHARTVCRRCVPCRGARATRYADPSRGPPLPALPALLRGGSLAGPFNLWSLAFDPALDAAVGRSSQRAGNRAAIVREGVCLAPPSPLAPLSRATAVLVEAVQPPLCIPMPESMSFAARHLTPLRARLVVCRFCDVVAVVMWWLLCRSPGRAPLQGQACSCP
jgi:hypothetical protein